jgi:pyruvate-ferredoxin/flavodoxin oxidoreductase
MISEHTLTIDGNEAAARIAHLTSEVIAIYPITPASPMGEWSDEWSSLGKVNLWGSVPRVIEMQSEAGAAGAIHGALQAGALTTTFTASQGLLLMLPNMYKIAGELSPTVFHIAARSLACQALSIFGDHSDVMSARSTGFAMLASNCPQEVMDMALISHAATLRSRIPILHFFDGFRTSHEVAKLSAVNEEMVRQLIDDRAIDEHRSRALSPEHPVLRGSSQNPDVYFQARETVNPFYDAFPTVVEDVMRSFGKLTGRHYRAFDYVGDPQAERVIVLMGSGAETAEETVDYLQREGEGVGIVKVRLYRPFDEVAFLTALPTTAKAIAVLDRTKEPGADGEPLYKDVMTALARDTLHAGRGEQRFAHMPMVVGGRYGLSSKEFTPAMVKRVFDELRADKPRNGFTIGIHDDVSHSSLDWDPAFRTDAHADSVQALFYGLGSDGTVSANKNSIKIIGEATDLYAQGYFVYDSKKSGATTVSHLRFGPTPIRSSYLIEEGEANFIGCHQPQFLGSVEMLSRAANGAVFLVNTAIAPEAFWDRLPAELQQQASDKQLRLFCIDAYKVAADCGLGKRINTIMQTCFFAISGVLPRAQAIDAIKAAVEKSYGRRGQRDRQDQLSAIDATLDGLHEVPARCAADHSRAVRRNRGRRQLYRSRYPAHHGRRGRLDPGQRPALSTAVSPRAPAPSKNATWRWKFRSGTRTCAPSAANARWSARMRRYAQRPSPRHYLPTRRIPSSPAHAKQGLSRRPCHELPGGAGGLHRLHAVRRHLPDPRQEQRQPQGPEHGHAITAVGGRARQLGFLYPASRVFPHNGQDHARSPAPCCWSRCSSSPAPASAAAKRRTSSWPASCLAIAW